MVAVYCAAKMLIEKKIDRIIITRPTVSEEQLGYLPGDLEDKMDPWMAPIYENMNLCVGYEETKTLIENNTVQIKPLAYMRGQTFTNCAIIVDESQNVTHAQMEMLLGRLGRKSKMIICGDLRQKDLKRNQKSGLPFLLQVSKSVHEVGDIELITNHRHELVEKILDLYKEYTSNA